MFERILVPLDGSPVAEAVLSHVRQILKLPGSKVVLFQSVPMPYGPDLDPAPIIAAGEEAARQYLGSRVALLNREGISTSSVVRVGPEVDGILQAAREESATLIAMSTHGRTGLPRFILGSVSERVVRSSSFPVLVVRSYRNGRPAGLAEHAFRTVLAPVDGSPASLAVLPSVREFARVFDSRVIVLGVVETAPEKEDPLVREATNALAREGVKLDSIVRIGNPAAEILEVAARHGADLIVMATHGRRGPSRWLLGSVTEKVLRAAEVPLLVVPRGAA